MHILPILLHGFNISAMALANTWLGTNLPIKVLTVDITNKCNMRCKFCYYARERGGSELSDTEWEERIRKYRKSGYRFALWAGGEPMVRVQLMKKLVSYFDLNVIFTNGSWPLIKLPNTTYFISIDGNREMYEKQRGMYYDKVKENIEKYDGKVVVDMTINAENMESIEEHAETWALHPKVKAVIYDLYTRELDEVSGLGLTEEQRAEVINRIIALRKKYHNIFPDESSLRLMSKKNRGKVIKKCIARDIECLDSQGERKLPCVLGKNIDCSDCGKWIPYVFSSIYHKPNPLTLLRFLKLVS